MSGWSRDEYAMRQWVAAVFNSDKPRRASADESPALPNHVAREGSNPANPTNSRPRYSGRDGVRNWLGDLLGTDENSRGLSSDRW